MTVTNAGQRGQRPSQPKPDIPVDAAVQAKVRAGRTQAVCNAISLFVEMPLGGLAQIEAHNLPDDQVGAFQLDLIAIEAHKTPLAEAVVQVADSVPVVGVLLDRLAQATPFSALFGVVISLAAQIGENHRRLPDQLRSLAPNLVGRDELAATVLAARDLDSRASDANGARREPVPAT